MKKAGRKPIHKFNTIEVGEKAELIDSAAKYPYQYIGTDRKDKKAFKIVRKGERIYALRTK